MEDFLKNLFYSGVGLVSMTAEKLEEVIDELTEKKENCRKKKAKKLSMSL